MIARGRVDLVLSSQVERGVEVPGVVSCNEDADCPGGQRCQPDRRCQ